MGRRALTVLLLVGAAFVPGATASRPETSGSWQPSTGNLATVTLVAANGAADLIVSPNAEGIVIVGVTGPVAVSGITALPHKGYVELSAGPTVAPGGTLRFTLRTNVALPSGTTISVGVFPHPGSGSGLEQVDVTEAVQLQAVATRTAKHAKVTANEPFGGVVELFHSRGPDQQAFCAALPRGFAQLVPEPPVTTPTPPVLEARSSLGVFGKIRFGQQVKATFPLAALATYLRKYRKFACGGLELHLRDANGNRVVLIGARVRL